MSAIQPFDTLSDATAGESIPLPEELASLYGPRRLTSRTGRPTTLANFVTTLDGVVSPGIPGQAGGGPISGENRQDRALVGLRRAVADAVVVGAGTARAVPRHLWTPAHVLPDLALAYQALRASLGKPTLPLNVIVTASGDVDLGLPVVASGEVPVLIVTTTRGAEHLRPETLPPSVRVAEVVCSGTIGAETILEAISQERPSRVVLVEGGPHLLGVFPAAGLIDALFLTLAPQIAGRGRATTVPASPRAGAWPRSTRSGAAWSW
jgi:riboflavin biosynthesis pyrimidine reductase